jgi:hypothetical protein
MLPARAPGRMPNGISMLLQPDSMQVRMPSDVLNKFQGHIKEHCTHMHDFS